MIIKIICMLIAGFLTVKSVMEDKYDLTMYWIFVVAYWAFSIWGG